FAPVRSATTRPIMGAAFTSLRESCWLPTQSSPATRRPAAMAAIAAYGSPNVSVTNSTVSGNRAPRASTVFGPGDRGGIMVSGTAAGTVSIDHCTITNNLAASDGGGGGVCVDLPATTIYVWSSIIAGNMAPGIADLRDPAPATVSYSAIGSGA